MANDRIYLVDNETGEQILLAKYWGNRYSVFHTQEELQAWFDEHVEIKGYNLSGVCPVHLEVESDKPSGLL